jgi:ABC-2 type transport system permease protein
MTGILFGTTVSVGFKTTGIKYGITIGGTMLSCFLSGMMASDIKYLISQNAPIVGYLSPATLISDAFYSLYYYDGFSRYFVNIAILCALCVLFGVITCVVLRRKTYASI